MAALLLLVMAFWQALRENCRKISLFRSLLYLSGFVHLMYNLSVNKGEFKWRKGIYLI